MLVDGDIFVKNRIPISTLEYSSIGSPRSNVAITNAFKNRKIESEYLRNTFPAGFAVDGALELNQSQERKYKLGDNHTSNGVLSRTASQSFTAWTRGGSQVDEESTEVTGEDGDPFSHVAGPSYRDIMKQGTSVQSSQQNMVSDNSLCLLSAGRVSLSERRRKPDKKPKSPIRAQVFNQPASMPFLTSAVTGGGNVATDSFENIESYQSWLEAQRSGANQKIWLVKGGNLDYNYSSCDFKSTRGQSRAIVIGTEGAAAPVIKEIPRTIPGTLTLEIFTKIQLLKSGTVLEDRSCLQKKLPSDCTVEDVKNAVVKEIVAGIATTFHLDPTKILTDENNFPINFNRIELLFQYFNPVISSWRAIASEVDWLHAKQLCMSHHERQTAQQQGQLSVHHKSQLRPHERQLEQLERGKISLMYALQNHSEEYILRIMKHYHERRKRIAEEDKEHISLKLLTEALANMTGSFKVKGRSHNSDGKAESKLPRSSSAPSAAAPVPVRTSPAVVQKSILYPKPAEYMKIKKQNEQLSAKQEILAQRLEDQLLKTKW